MSIIKIAVILILFAILLSLGSALLSMLRGKGSSGKTAKALTLRVGLSLGLFALLMAAYAAGLITPHGILPPANL